jgi:hypothetical protein
LSCTAARQPAKSKTGPRTKKTHQGHQPLKRQPSMEEKNATFVYRSCGAVATFSTLPPLEHQTQHNERISKEAESLPTEGRVQTRVAFISSIFAVTIGCDIHLP